MPTPVQVMVGPGAAHQMIFMKIYFKIFFYSDTLNHCRTRSRDTKYRLLKKITRWILSYIEIKPLFNVLSSPARIEQDAGNYFPLFSGEIWVPIYLAGTF